MIQKLKNIKQRTIFTLVAMFNIVWYTVVVLFANFHDHIVQSELTVAWFSAWTVELALLFGIKITSNKSNLPECIASKIPEVSIQVNDDDKDIIVKETEDDGVG